MRLAVALALLLPSLVHSDPPPVDGNRLEISGDIDSDTADVFVARLDGANFDREVVITINTPGGDLRAALRMAQGIEKLAGRGAHIRCVVDGWAASAGLFVLESCPVRQMTERSSLMAHEPWIGINGPINPAAAERVRARVAEALHTYVTQCAARMKISYADFAARIQDREWWMLPEDALTIGAVDTIIPSPNASPHGN